MKLKPNQAWKCLPNNMTSHKGMHKWSMNKWYAVEGEIELCNWGFHASKTILDACQYVTPGWICLVEYDGEVLEASDKLVAQRMRIIKRYEWTKKDSMQFSIFNVKLAMECINKEKDSEVWNACLGCIKAIKDVLVEDSEENRAAASVARRVVSGSALSAVSSAKIAAWKAASAAMRAVDSAESSTERAAWKAASAAMGAADSAVRATLSAAWSAANTANAARNAASTARAKQERWIINHINNNKKGVE